MTQRVVVVLLLLFIQSNAVTQCAADAQKGEPTRKIFRVGPIYPFRAGYPANKGGLGYEEHNLLTVPQTRVTPDGKFSVDIRVYNDGGFDYFYNVYWDSLLTLPGAIALYDAQKHYVRDLMGPRPIPGTSVEVFGGSRATPASNDWTPIQSPGYAGTTVKCGPLSVPPGTYYVQVIFFTSLVHPPPDRSDAGWPPLDDRTEIMRSEAVQITVIEPKTAHVTSPPNPVPSKYSKNHTNPPASAQAFETWVKAADNKLDLDGKEPTATQAALMRRLRAGDSVTDDTVKSVVNVWEDAEIGTYANTLRLITALQPLLYGRPSLQAYICQKKGRLLRLGGNEAGAAAEYGAALRLLTPVNKDVIQGRQNALVEYADALYALSDKAAAEELYLEALGDDWYTDTDGPSMRTRRDLYVRAALGLIDCRKGNLQALLQIYIAPATNGEVAPALIRAIEDAGGTVPTDSPLRMWKGGSE